MFLPMKKTHIIATIGPATVKKEIMEELLMKGADIFRFNFSHGTYEWFRNAMLTAREAGVKAGRTPLMMLDTKGPAIRTGDITHPLALKKGDIIIFTTKKEEQDPSAKIISVNYTGILEDIEPGNIIELDNGLFQVEVIKEEKTRFHGRVLSDAVLGSRKHINLPGIRVGLPTISEQDMADIRFGLEMGIDFIALSFTRSGNDIEKVREICKKEGKDSVKIFAKIENAEGIDHFEDILKHADGIMVARGDLGIELPYEMIPSLQKKMVKRTREEKKYSIVATQMLESMTEAPFPTRAEVSDVTTAVWENASAVMLSGETASGKNPVKTVEVMAKIIAYAEEHRASIV